MKATAILISLFVLYSCGDDFDDNRPTQDKTGKEYEDVSVNDDGGIHIEIDTTVTDYEFTIKI